MFRLKVKEVQFIPVHCGWFPEGQTRRGWKWRGFWRLECFAPGFEVAVIVLGDLANTVGRWRLLTEPDEVTSTQHPACWPYEI